MFYVFQQRYHRHRPSTTTVIREVKSDLKSPANQAKNDDSDYLNSIVSKLPKLIEGQFREARKQVNSSRFMPSTVVNGTELSKQSIETFY
jgi:hypothetical protein